MPHKMAAILKSVTHESREWVHGYGGRKSDGVTSQIVIWSEIFVYECNCHALLRWPWKVGFCFTFVFCSRILWISLILGHKQQDVLSKWGGLLVVRKERLKNKTKSTVVWNTFWHGVYRTILIAPCFCTAYLHLLGCNPGAWRSGNIF